MAAVQYTDEFRDVLIPPVLWGKDHWTTLAYITLSIIDYSAHGGCQVGYDPRMRHNRRNFRVLAAENPYPPQRNQGKHAHTPCHGHEPMAEEHSSRLRTGKLARGHDDWDCIQDMVGMGLFNLMGPEEMVPGKVLNLTLMGWRWITAVWQHKAAGGAYDTFDPVKAMVLDPNDEVTNHPRP